MTTSRHRPNRGFLASLFDFSFSSYVTPKLIRVIYAIVVVVAGLLALATAATAFRINAVLGLLVLVVIGPLLFLFYVILYRVGLEVVMAVFKIAENTSVLAAAAEAAAAAPAPPVYAPPPPVYAPTPPPEARPAPTAPADPWSGGVSRAYGSDSAAPYGSPQPPASYPARYPDEPYPPTRRGY